MYLNLEQRRPGGTVVEDATLYCFVSFQQIRESLVCALELNTARIIPLDSDGAETMTVSAMDANHCPGSIMLLFEGYFGTILYTGDFRYTSDMFIDTPLSFPKCIDILYLDNTYCSPQCDFPSRAEARKQIIQIIEDHPTDNVLIGVRQLGKEDLLTDLAKHFSTYIVVDQNQYEKLEILEVPNVFTTDFDKGYIHAVPHYQITEKALLEWNMENPTIGILPSALYTGVGGGQSGKKAFVHVVPYSDHSPYGELHTFVARLKPRSVLPLVREKKGIFGCDLTSRTDMSCFDKYLDPSARAKFVVPESVQRLMASLGATTFAEGTLNQKSFPRTVAAAQLHRKPLYQTKVSVGSKGIIFDDSPVKSLNQSDLEHQESASEVQQSELSSTPKVARPGMESTGGTDDATKSDAQSRDGCGPSGSVFCTKVDTKPDFEDTEAVESISTSEEGEVPDFARKRHHPGQGLFEQKVKKKKDVEKMSPLKSLCTQRLKHQGRLSNTKRNMIYHFLKMNVGKSEDVIDLTTNDEEEKEIETINVDSDLENGGPRFQSRK